MASSLLWKDLSAAHVASLSEARDAVEARRYAPTRTTRLPAARDPTPSRPSSPARLGTGARLLGGVRRLLIDILGFSTTPSPKALVLLEFYANSLRFAAECRFTTEKTSAFFSIMRANHEETVHGLLSLDQSLLYFKELLLLHSVQRPPYSVGIFSFKDVTLISDYANSTCVARARRASAPNPFRAPRRSARGRSRPGRHRAGRLTPRPPAFPPPTVRSRARAQVL